MLVGIRKTPTQWHHEQAPSHPTVSKTELHTDAAELSGNQRQTIEDLQHLRALLKNRQLAIEHVFTATHGRLMTDDERRLFEKIGNAG